jgi:hypothetical protein
VMQMRPNLTVPIDIIGDDLEIQGKWILSCVLHRWT